MHVSSYYEMSYVYVPFTPLKYDGQKGLITAQINKGFYKDLAQVLAYYEVPYRKERDVINISRKHSQDKDLSLELYVESFE